mgnify:CR=1 FL=1
MYQTTYIIGLIWFSDSNKKGLFSLYFCRYGYFHVLVWCVYRVEAVEANNLFYHLAYAYYLTPFLEEDDEGEEGKEDSSRRRKKTKKQTP